MPINSFLYPGAKVTTAYEVANSCRFQDSDSSEMSRAIASTGSNTTWTVSAWVKRVELGQSSPIFGTGDGNANNDARMVFFDADDKIECSYYNSGYTYEVTTNRLFRDCSAWYHICILFDTTESTSTDRIKIYVNGTQETSFATSSYPSEDATFNFGNTSYTHYVNDMGGRNIRGSHYIAELVYLDGTALAVTNFGEFDSDSPTIWKPKDVSGLSSSKGVNGFYMDFEDSSNLGNDVWGGTDFTESNLDAQNQTSDTCTNNFATLNPLVNFNSGVFSEGNCAITFGDDTISTIGVTRGRWYWEAQRTNTSTEAHFGIGLSKGFYSATSIVSDGDRLYTRSGTTYFSAVSNLSILTFGSNSGTSATVGNGDVIGFYLDLESDTKNITIKKNDGATPIVNVDLTYSGAEPIFAFCRMNSGCSSSWNFGNPVAALSSANSDPNGYGSFEYSTTLNSVDYYALCTKNLAEFG